MICNDLVLCVKLFLWFFTSAPSGILPSTNLVDYAGNRHCSVFSFSHFSGFFLFWNLKICFYQFPLFFSVFFFCSSFYFLFFFLFLVLFLPSLFIHIIFLSPLLFTFKICYPFFSLFLLCFVCFSLICSITI